MSFNVAETIRKVGVEHFSKYLNAGSVSEKILYLDRAIECFEKAFTVIESQLSSHVIEK